MWDISTAKRASYHKTVFLFATAIQTKFVPIEEGSELDNNFIARDGPVTFPILNKQRLFDNAVLTALPNPARQEQVRHLKNPDDMTQHQKNTEGTHEAPVGREGTT